MSTVSNVQKRLNSLHLQQLGYTLGEVGKVLAPADAGVQVSLGIPVDDPILDIREPIAATVKAENGADSPQIDVASKIVSHSVQGNLKPVAGIKNIIAVASGKGGVGKSTVAVNLALALSRGGAQVGVLDADIYGPSLPHMLGLVGEAPSSEDGKTMQPLEAHGLKAMSIGFLVDPDQPMVWRGPMVTSALNQLMHQTEWGDLDYLIVDMPPGTGDIQLTLSQKVPVSGAVIVTTPQEIATLDARKGLAMFRKVSISVLGVIENMSMHVCSSCGHQEALFGAGGAEKMGSDFGVLLLGQLPLAAHIREQTDAGTPTVISAPESPAGIAYREAALRVAAAQAVQRTDYSAKFGNIVVEGA